jgi:hypothetical protein
VVFLGVSLRSRVQGDETLMILSRYFPDSDDCLCVRGLPYRFATLPNSVSVSDLAPSRNAHAGFIIATSMPAGDSVSSCHPVWSVLA